ncbi:MAG: hypothetical protein WB421_09655 [Terriglobales bacterium]|jgi:hypothetical protein
MISVDLAARATVKERPFQGRVIRSDNLRGAEAPLFHGTPYGTPQVGEEGILPVADLISRR